MHCPFRSPKRCKQNAADPRNGDNEKHSLSVYRARPACKLPRTAVRGEQVCTGGLIRPLSPAEWAFKRFVISDARASRNAPWRGFRDDEGRCVNGVGWSLRAKGSRPVYESARRRLRMGHTTNHPNRKQINKSAWILSTARCVGRKLEASDLPCGTRSRSAFSSSHCELALAT